LLEPQQKVVKPSFGWNFHFAVPVRASSAITVSLTPVVMYIVPPTTIYGKCSESFVTHLAR